MKSIQTDLDYNALYKRLKANGKIGKLSMIAIYDKLLSGFGGLPVKKAAKALEDEKDVKALDNSLETL